MCTSNLFVIELGVKLSVWKCHVEVKFQNMLSLEVHKIRCSSRLNLFVFGEVLCKLRAIFSPLVEVSNHDGSSPP